MTLAGFSMPVAGTTVAGLRSPGTGGQRVLALHGWLDNAASFVPLAAQLPGLELVAIDLPGHGHSAHLPPGTQYNTPGAICHVLEVADALGWDRFVLLGHSMGAGIASLTAAAAPERVERLIAIEALGGLRGPENETAQRLREHVRAARALPTRRLRVFPDLAAPIRARMMTNQLSEPCARLLVERGVKPVDGGYSWCSDQRLMLPTAMRLSEAQIDDLLAAIECPTQVIYATPAQAYYPEPLRSERISLLRDGRLAVFPGTHHLHMEHPQRVAEVIRTFLAG
ncbi:alpha/beta hydrolase [Stenotrophomonas sp.]|jgi:pimeloyl-ACP methyl ester carboxylesterase|uniref:alpha/beta fold hydrolase n=1 Tax=Stenotrophomonas sp. TaxID=69392 RepID=UPI0029B70B26|nr:alpha/beta hydrolase [Stenotrophomonas sp.]MDX3936627.1 alpha/beta hydrolase [Stenotrophomonas sp.]